MSELIPIVDRGDDVQAVMGRDLHAFLEVKEPYTDWLPRMVAYGFEEGKDFVQKNLIGQDKLGRRRETINHVITLDMAKHLAMIQRTDRGRQAREYFIECEKLARQPRVDVSQLTRMDLLQIAMNAEEERLALEAENKVLEPKAEAYDSFMDAEGMYSVGTVGKMLGIGRTTLFRKLRNEGVFISKGPMRNTPYQKYMKHFEVKSSTATHADGTESVRYTTYVQPSGVDFIRRKLGLLTIDPLPPAGVQGQVPGLF